ncbi:MAG TPA: trypsin-like peptidase domain-containing protein [Pedococcus sp.]
MTTAAVAVAAQPVRAHTHPSATDRAAPAVVAVETRAVIDTVLIEDRGAADEAGVRIGAFKSRANPRLRWANGFTVTGNGDIVTTGTVRMSAADRERARVFAANLAFNKRYGTSVPKDPFARQQLSGNLQRRLQGCYAGRINEAGGCLVDIREEIVVHPNVTTAFQKRYEVRAQVVDFTPDVAVLRVQGASGWPTVGVASTITDKTYALNVLGFDRPSLPGPDNQVKAYVQHLAKGASGGYVFKTVGLKPDEAENSRKFEATLRANPSFVGGPVLDDKGVVVGLLPRPLSAGQAAPDLVPLAAIQDILQASGVTPRTSPVDSYYENAMHEFKNDGFAAALPNLEAAVKLFPGHALATANLAVAKAAVASGKGRPSPTRTTAGGASGQTDVPWLLVGGAALLIVGLGAAAVGLVLWRGKRRRGEGPEAPHPAAVPVAAGVGATSRAAPSATPRPGGQPSRAVPTGQGTRPSPGPSSRVAPPGQPAGRPAGQPARPAAPGQPSRQGPPGSAAQPPRATSGQASALRQRPDAKSTPAGERTAPAAAGAAAQPSALSGQVRFCTSCGGQLSSQHQFCSWCGQPVG